MSESVAIVVIDDNPGSLELLSEALARSDAAIYTASNPVEGVAPC
jgi:CheY-like chemotaxis protein